MSLSSFASDLFKPDFRADKFVQALAMDDVKYVAKILQHYPQAANWCDAAGRSSLNLAVDARMPGACRLLIDANADIERMDPKMKMQPLNRALHTADIDIADMLIDKGANVNTRDGNGSGSTSGQTPLFMAVSKCPVKILQKLVAQGADINAVCSDFTPLMLAAMADNAESIKYLVSAGADIGIKKQNGVTADRLARSKAMEDYLGAVKKKYDAVDKAALKAKADMEAIREAERQRLAESAATAEAIDMLTSGTKGPMRVPRPLRLRMPY